MKPFILIALMSVIVTSCAATRPQQCQIPALNVNWWTIDSQIQSLVDKQHNQVISCADKKVEQHACLSYDDILEIFTLLQMCRECAGQIPTQNQHQN